MNQPGTVITGNDFDARRQRWFDFGQLFLHAIDDVQGVHTVAHDNDAGDGLSFALPFRGSFADIRAERDRPDITNPHGSAVLCSNGHCFEVAQRTQIPEAANHVLRAAHFEDSPADFIRAGPDLFNDCGERYGVGAQFVRIEIHLVLFDESTNGRDFGDARDRFELVAQIPILNAAQFGQAALMGAIH